ncbi:hypothetical protein HUJ05_009745 [Dendroctonus ponderosae]|nr:hypothetical protein HUJ05_009745 [Dendroctonus ponderosae]
MNCFLLEQNVSGILSSSKESCTLHTFSVAIGFLIPATLTELPVDAVAPALRVRGHADAHSKPGALAEFLRPPEGVPNPSLHLLAVDRSLLRVLYYVIIEYFKVNTSTSTAAHQHLVLKLYSSRLNQLTLPGVGACFGHCYTFYDLNSDYRHLKFTSLPCDSGLKNRNYNSEVE